MDLDLSGKRARKLIDDYKLTDDEIQQIVASARINLATFDPEYKTNVTQIAQELQKSRPTVYGWADRAIIATIDSLRNIRTGRPPKQSQRVAGSTRTRGRRGRSGSGQRHTAVLAATIQEPAGNGIVEIKEDTVL